MRKITFLALVLLPLLYGCQSTSKTKADVQTMSVQDLILAGKTDEVRALFESAADINMADSKGNTALHTAALVDDSQLISFLLYKGADPELKNIDGDTALHMALKNAALESAAILAALKSNIFAEDGRGLSALDIGLSYKDFFYEALLTTRTGELQDARGQSIIHYLVRGRNAGGIDFCIQKKIPLSAEDINGMRPLGLAYKQADIESIRIAAALILGNAAPERGDYAYFEDAVKTRNPSMRFDEGQTPLHFAVILGQSALANYLIERGANIKAKDISGSSPLHEAVRYGRPEIALSLLAAGADINARDSMGKTPLLIITPPQYRSQMYKLLLEKGARANARDSFGDNALHIAALTDADVSILESLILHGADINERNKNGLSPLAQALERQTLPHIDFFTSRGADIHAEDIAGNTPLTRALEADLSILKKLINNANITSRDSMGNTPLLIAVQKNCDPEKIQFLLNAGSEVNVRNRNGTSALYIAVKHNNRIIGEKLLERGADVFSANNENNSPLKLALSTGGEVQDWILSSEVIKAVDGVGNTPLHYAAEWKFNTAAALILEKGGNPDSQNTNGESALFSAVKVNSPFIIGLLIKNGANHNLRDFLGNTALHTSVRWKASATAALLLENGADINAQNLSGKTPLHEAARSGRIEMAVLLLDKKADIHAADATGRTPLMDAAQAQQSNLASLLIKRGASPAMQEMYGRTAYHEAAETGNIELINILRNAGGNPLARDTHGRTPLSLVLDKDISLIAAVLGNDVNLADSDGNTPVHIGIRGNISPSLLTSFIDSGFPINRRNSEGAAPLLLAVKTGKDKLARVLLERGGDPFVGDNSGECALSYAIKNKPDMLNLIVQNAGTKRDIAGETILHYAARDANPTIVKQLLEIGLDKSIKNISGETAYDIAIRWQRPDIAALLK